LARLRGEVKPQGDAAASAPSVDNAAKASEMAAKSAMLKAVMADSPKVAQQIVNAAVPEAKQQSNSVPPVDPSPEPLVATVVDSSPVSQAVIESDETIAAQPIEPTVTAEVSTVSQAVGEVVTVDETVSKPVQADPQHLALVNNITQGTWFEMQGEAGEKYRCRLAAIIRSVGKYIFVNRSGMKVAEESRESLAIALQTKRLTILDDGMLFDRALEAVIGTLREQRTLN